jgi:hypothetical protein
MLNVSPYFQVLNKLIYFTKFFYEFCDIGGHPYIVILNFL